MGLGTVVSLKDRSQGYSTLLMVVLNVPGYGTPVLLSTHPFDGQAGPVFPGIGILPAGNYEGRIAQQDIDAIQQRSQLGIDRASKVTIHIMDNDREIYNTICKVYGFRGSSMRIAMVMWQAGTANFSDDAPILFTGTCDMEVPRKGGSVISLTATTGHNTATIKLPLFPAQNRCPLYFPRNAAERALAVLPDSTMCPYSVDQPGGVGNYGPGPNVVNSYGDQITDGSGAFILCDYIRSNKNDATSGCMPRLGNPATTSVAPDGDLKHDTSGRHTGAFAGIEWSPGTYYAINKEYTSGNKFATFSFLNSSIIGQYLTLLYGTQWVNAKIANVIESGNDSKSEAMACTGDISDSGVVQVTVNGISLNRAPSGDNNLWWDYNNTGGRFGSMNTDSGYNKAGTYSALGDPYGSIACLRTTFYKDIFTGFGTPTIRILATGPQLWVYAPIQSISANGSSLVITWPSGFSNTYLSGPGHIIGNSNSNLNVAVGVYTGFTSSTITFSSSAVGSGTGGFLGQLSNLVKSNPAWVLLDIMLKSNWDVSEIDMATFSTAGEFCDVPISYVNQSGDTTTHPRFKCQFALEQRRSAAEVISNVLRCCNGYLAWSQSGLLQMYINQTLADSQPGAVPGSNYNTAVPSVLADGTPANGHVAYLFDESSITTTRDGELDLEFEQNATVTTPNQIFIQFQDEDNQYADDSLGEFDVNAVSRSGGSLQPGGSLIPETLGVLGISNFDQAVRIANVYLAERQYGNELGEPIGTRIMDIATSVKCESLRVGHIVAVSLQMYNWDKQLFRVLRISPDTDGHSWKLAIQWHEDVWYTDAYGQAPQAFYSSTGSNRPNRIPLPWQPFAEQPVVPAGDAYRNEWNFQITEVDNIQANGNISVQLQVSGVLPINQIKSAMQQPRVPIQATSVTTGGLVAGGLTYLIELCAIDSSGNYSPHSGIITITVPAGTNTNLITVANIGWPVGADGYAVFVGIDHYSITNQYTVTGSTPPVTISIGASSALDKTATFAPPDLASGSMELKGKLVIHEGIIGETVAVLSASPHRVTIGAPASGTLGDLTVGGTVTRKLILIGRPNSQGSDLPIVEFNILSNTGSVLTVDRDPTVDLQLNDVVVVSSQANISSSTTIGDTLFVAPGNPYAPIGVDSNDVGYLVMIVRGTGRYQQRIITGVSGGTTYAIDHPWNIRPDATSMFIVVEKSWRYLSDVAQVSNSGYGNAKVSLLNTDNYLDKPVLVMGLVGDQQGNAFASEFRSPFRIMWIFGVQGTRVITATGDQLPSDGLVLCDTSGLTGTATTLSGSITPSDSPITFASGTGITNGTYIRIGTEYIKIDSGTGATRDVTRGALASTAASHTSGDAVNIPGFLEFNLLPLADQPNQPLIVSKITSDINYVVVNADGADTFPGGGTQVILADASASGGTVTLKAPG